MANDKDVGLAVNEALPDTSVVLPVVVGARLEAEIRDRPIANRLAEVIRRREAGEDAGDRVVPVVCTDLWYLNDDRLQARPTVTIGDPDVNAATAFLARRLPTAFVVEGTLRIQLDLELLDLRACLWGTDARTTASCSDLFVDRYLEDFLRAAKNA